MGTSGDVAVCWVKLEQAAIFSLSSGNVILCSGFRVKILPRMSFSSSDSGRIVFKKPGCLVKAR